MAFFEGTGSGGARRAPSRTTPAQMSTVPTAGTALPVRMPSPYPTTPPPLSAADIAEFGQRRRAASRTLEQALARRQAGQAQVEAFFQQFTNRLGRERTNTRRDAMQELGGRGTARDPRFGGRALVRIRDEFADRQAEGQLDRASQLAALEQIVNEARTARDDELTAISADQARRRTSLEQLLTQVGA